MPRLLSALIFLFIFLFTLSSEVLAICEQCPPGATLGDNSICVVSVAAPAGGGRPNTTTVPATLGCSAGQRASIPELNDAACQCVPQSDPGATGPAGQNATPLPVTISASASPARPTSGKGVACAPNERNPDTSIKGVGGIMTAVGCIPTNPPELVQGLLKYGILAAGVVAFLLMILGALNMITAEGNPDSINKAKERFYSAIVGLLFIIFSVLLLQIIGVDILGLPNFG